MGLGDAFRSWRLSREVRRLLSAGERRNAFALVSSVGGQLRASALVGLAQDCDEDEFFACAYTEYLARRYGLDVEQQLDDRGVSADVFALFEELDGPRSA